LAVLRPIDREEFVLCFVIHCLLVYWLNKSAWAWLGH
jgi:hypothetical protein